MFGNHLPLYKENSLEIPKLTAAWNREVGPAMETCADIVEDRKIACSSSPLHRGQSCALVAICCADRVASCQ